MQYHQGYTNRRKQRQELPNPILHQVLPHPGVVRTIFVDKIKIQRLLHPRVFRTIYVDKIKIKRLLHLRVVRTIFVDKIKIQLLLHPSGSAEYCIALYTN